MNKRLASYLEDNVKRFTRIMQALVLVLSGMTPILIGGHASALPQLTTRSATIDKSYTSQTNIQVDFGYTLITSSSVQSLTYQFCTTALGTCTTPTGLDARTSTTQVGQSGFPTNGTAFAPKNTTSDSGACLQSTAGTQFACYTRSTGTAGAGAATHSIAGLVGPTVAGTVYIRITTYSDGSYGTPVDAGTVAVSFGNRMTINAHVQEVLLMCVSATTIDDATASIGTSCTGGTSVNLGNVTPTVVNTTPVSNATLGGDDNNAYVQIQTNAQGGVVVGYRAVQDTSSGKLKVVGATCSGTSTTDQCFNSQGASQAAFSAGTENFGFTVAGTNCGDVGSAYSCTFASGTHKLKAASGYQGEGGPSGSNSSGSPYTYGAANGFAYEDTNSGTTNIASSTSIVANESLVLKYAATAQVSTPTGVYQAQNDFIATPTF